MEFSIYVSLTNGQGVNLIGVGKIEPKYIEAKPERDVTTPLMGTIWKPNLQSLSPLMLLAEGLKALKDIG